MARPKKLPVDSAVYNLKARLYSEEFKMLSEICNHTGKTKTEIIRILIRNFYEKMKNSFCGTN